MPTAKSPLSWVTMRIILPTITFVSQSLTYHPSRFLRWKAIQDAVFVDPVDGKQKIWSESNVSEDFDMALRLILKGYIVRCVSYLISLMLRFGPSILPIHPRTTTHWNANARHEFSLHRLFFLILNLILISDPFQGGLRILKERSKKAFR